MMAEREILYMLLFDGYVLLKAEWDIYHNFTPSLFQKIIHFVFFSLKVVFKGEIYKDVKREDCL